MHDNQLKTEINNLKSIFASTSYKTKILVVLLGDDDASNFLDLEDRLGLLRRATNTDGKSLLFVSPGASQNELTDFVKKLLTSLQPTCVEYYRDLSKHARRKRSRGSVPAPTTPPASGTSQILSLQGWNVRYEFKLGVFAEFRQEMDAAGRNYESAYEALLTPELLESISSWSPRFNEGRLLADAIAIRIIRCQLWTGQTTGAVRSWLNHRVCMRDLIDRRGKGTDNYGWEAWESTWSKTMAQLVARADVAALSSLEAPDPMSRKASTIFCLPEKAVPFGERILPWEMLHHEGYWLRKAKDHTRGRQRLALQMPEEDRAAPGQSPASVIANKSHLYDTYLTLDAHEENPIGDKPGYDYAKNIVGDLEDAIQSFSARQQLRAADHAELEVAIEHINSANWHEAIVILRSLWSQPLWRKAGWWPLVAEVGYILRDCALHNGHAETVLRTTWELSNKILPRRSNAPHDLRRCLEDPMFRGSRTDLVLSAQESMSPITPVLCFEKTIGHAGEPLRVQLRLIAHMHSNSTPLHIAEVKIVFEGGLRMVRLISESDETLSEDWSEPLFTSVQWREQSVSSGLGPSDMSSNASPAYTGKANLACHPDRPRVYDMTVIPREAGNVAIDSITVLVEEERFSLAYTISKPVVDYTVWWHLKDGRMAERKTKMDQEEALLKVLPKPPKLSITLPGLRKAFYANEVVDLQLCLFNEEQDTVTGTINVGLRSAHEHTASVSWIGAEHAAADESDDQADGASILQTKDLAVLASGSSEELGLSITNTAEALVYELEIFVQYHLVSERETPLNKTAMFELPFLRPFEANYDFDCRHDPARWPNFFDAGLVIEHTVPEEEDRPGRKHTVATGTSQTYALTARMFSFADETLVIERIALTADRVIGGAICQASAGRRKQVVEEGPDMFLEESTQTIEPKETQSFEFLINVQKVTLGDKHPVGLDLSMQIDWRRSNAATATTSTLELPRYVAPMAEPRALLTATRDLGSIVPGLRNLSFVIENPSTHFLTFSFTMESSEDFTFSGPKATSFSLVPLSRHSIEYMMVPRKMREWIPVRVQIVDSYFGQSLRVNPANDLVRADKKHNVSVWID